MPRPNFYMSKNDRQVILDLIRNYIDMWENAGIPMDDEEYSELVRVKKKVMNIEQTKSYKDSLVQDALDIADRVLKDKNK